MSEQAVSGLNAFSREKNRTVQALMMAACATAYSRMEDAQDFSIGTLLLNRLNTSEQYMMGNCFVTVPLPIAMFNVLFDVYNSKMSSMVIVRMLCFLK